MNARETAIVQGYLDCISGKQKASALRDNGKWTPTRCPQRCYKISFKTPDGLTYTGYPSNIQKMMEK